MSNEIWIEVLKSINQWLPAILGAWLGAHWSVRKMRLLNNPAEKPPSKIQSLVVRIARFIKSNWQLLVAAVFLIFGYVQAFSGTGPMDRLSIALVVLYTVLLCGGLSAIITVRLVGYMFRLLYRSEDKGKKPES